MATARYRELADWRPGEHPPQSHKPRGNDRLILVLLGDYFIEEMETAVGKVKGGPWAVEPMSDIAVIGGLDNQTFWKEAEEFDRFCEQTPPITVCTADLSMETQVYIYTHNGTWITGIARGWGFGDCANVYVEADEQIEGGTSGGPIVNDSGELVGIVSNCQRHQFSARKIQRNCPASTSYSSGLGMVFNIRGVWRQTRVKPGQ